MTDNTIPSEPSNDEEQKHICFPSCRGAGDPDVHGYPGEEVSTKLPGEEYELNLSSPF
jgi:hypothetical protein